MTGRARYAGTMLGTIALVAGAGAVLALGAWVLRSGGRVEADLRADLARATPAVAIVVSWHEPGSRRRPGADGRGGRHELHLRLRRPGGDEVPVAVIWTVDPRGAARLVEGATIAVRLHATRPALVFPDEPGFALPLDEYAQRRYGAPEAGPTSTRG